MQDAHGFENRRTQNLLERLENHPQLKDRIEAMLDVVEIAAGDVSKADEAEQRVIEIFANSVKRRCKPGPIASKANCKPMPTRALIYLARIKKS